MPLHPTATGAVIRCDQADCGAELVIASTHYAWDARRLGWAELESRWACPEHRRRLPAIVVATSRRVGSGPEGMGEGL